jgi:glucosamine kinase
VLARHGDDIARIIAFAIAARPADIAELGPDVMDAADQGDPLAQALIGEGVAYVTAGLAAIGWRAGDALCLTGGLGARYGRYLPPDLAASLAAVRGTALDGALQLASEAAR